MTDLGFNASGVEGQRSILNGVPTKPFVTNYRIPTSGGFIVINGEQVTRIVAAKGSPSNFGDGYSWTLTFHLSDGSTQVIHPSSWTKNFVRDVF